MGGDKKQFKRGASGDNGGFNPINSRTPEEYICVVGSSSNTFNGYMHVDPAINNWVANAHPLNVRGIPKFINPPAKTHDVYWANFIDPAIRIFSSKVAQPKPGDVITIMVYLKGYVYRNQVDWDASPYNLQLHQYSPWVRGNPEFDRDAKDKPTPPAPGKPRPKHAPDAPDFDPENVLDHDILMRTTDGNQNGIKRPNDTDAYLDYIHNIPRRIVYGETLGGSGVLKDVMVKLLLFNDKYQLSTYLKHGEFPDAAYWKSWLDTRSDQDISGVVPNDTGSFYDAALAFSSIPWQTRWKRLIKAGLQPPGINRKKVKIRRFDYVGHSDGGSFYFLYGWANKKGELPNKEVESMNKDELSGSLNSHIVTRDAFAQLLGCNLGKEMGPALVGIFKEVVACEDSTFFDHILDTPDSMPVPAEQAEWKSYKRGH